MASGYDVRKIDKLFEIKAAVKKLAVLSEKHIEAVDEYLWETFDGIKNIPKDLTITATNDAMKTAITLIKEILQEFDNIGE